MSRSTAVEEGFFYGALKIALGVFIGGLAAMFAYEYILSVRLQGAFSSLKQAMPVVSKPYRVEVEVPRPPVGEIQWSDDPDSKKIIKR